jgi:hypothetical protein
MNEKPCVLLVPDWGPLLELQRRKQLHSLFLPFLSLAVPDAVIHYLVRFCGDEGKALAVWVSQCNIPVFQTRAFNNGHVGGDRLHPYCAHELVDKCLQETMQEITTQQGKLKAIFLLDDYKCFQGSSFRAYGECTLITLPALEKFIARNPEKCAKVAPQTNRMQDRATKANVRQAPQSALIGWMNSFQVAAPKGMEKQLRALAGHTADFCKKGIDSLKSRQPFESKKADSDLVKQFRRSIRQG